MHSIPASPAFARLLMAGAGFFQVKLALDAAARFVGQMVVLIGAGHRLPLGLKH